MGKQYFTTFLLNNKYLTPGELKRALENQNTAPACPGVAALDAHFLTAQQVRTLKSLQAQTGTSFCDLAVQHGYVSEVQARDIRIRQTKAHVLFQNSLVEMHILTLEELENALAHFERCGQGADGEGGGPGADARENEQVRPEADRAPEIPLKDYTFTALIEHLTGLVSGGLRFAPARQVREYTFEWLACQKITGELCMVTGLSGCDESMAGLAALFDRGKSTGMDGLAQDAIGEFMNYYNAQLLAKISDDGLDLELEPPNVIHGGMIFSADSMFAIPFSIPCGSYEFFVALDCTIRPGI